MNRRARLCGWLVTVLMGADTGFMAAVALLPSDHVQPTWWRVLAVALGVGNALAALLFTVALATPEDT